MASIQRRIAKDGTETFRVGYRRDGKLCWSPTLADPEGAAELKSLIERIGPEAALAVLMRRAGRARDSTVPLLSEFFETYLTGVESHAARGTVPEYRRTAERTWMPRFGPLPIDSIDRTMIEEWVAWQRQQETVRSKKRRAKIAAFNAVCADEDKQPMPTPLLYRAKSIKNAHGILSGVFSAAVDAGIIAQNSAKGVDMPSDEEDHEMEIFTEEEWQAFYAAMQPHYLPLTLFLIATGVRIGEATAVQVRDLDLDAQRYVDGVENAAPTVQIRRAWKRGETHSADYLGSPKSRRGKRTIVLPAGLIDVLRPLVERRAPDEFLFLTVEGKRIHSGRFRDRQWNKAHRRAKLTKRLTPHSLRHTSASWLLTAGIAPQVVQHRLGHESLSTTSKVYAHLLTDAQAGAASVTDAALTTPPPALPEIEQ